MNVTFINPDKTKPMLDTSVSVESWTTVHLVLWFQIHFNVTLKSVSLLNAHLWLFWFHLKEGFPFSGKNINDFTEAVDDVIRVIYTRSSSTSCSANSLSSYTIMKSCWFHLLHPQSTLFTLVLTTSAVIPAVI